MTLKSDNKFEEKMTCGLENDTRNLMGALESLKNFHFKPNLGVCVCVCVGGAGAQLYPPLVGFPLITQK